MKTTPVKKGKFTIYTMKPNGIAIRREFQIPEDRVPTLIDVLGVSHCSLGPARMTQENPGPPPHKEHFRGEIVFNPQKTILVPGWNHPLLVTEYKCMHQWKNLIPIVATKPQIWQVVEANLNADFKELLAIVQYEVPEKREGYFNSGRYDIPSCDSVYLEADLPHGHPDYRPGPTHREREKLLSKERLNLNDPDDLQKF